MSSQNWQSVKLSEITSKIGSGATPRGGKESYKDSGITLIRSLNVYDFYFDYDGLAFIDERQAKELDNVEVKPKDILLNITGASVARCCMVPEKLLPARVNQHVSIIRTKPEIANPHFVFYTINSPFYKSHLLTLAQGGATREALTKETIEKFEIPLPPLPTQRRIADILSAYDDLIENNTRRIRILEGMAQVIYQEWFGMVDKKSMPEGWELKPFSQLVDIDPTTPVDKQIKKPFVGMNALSETSMIIDSSLIEMRTGNSGAKFQNRDVLFPRITPSVENGKGAFVQFLKDGQVSIGSTEIIVFREKELNAEYIYFLSREHEFRGNAINSMVGASGRQRVQQKCFDSFMVAKPPKKLLEKYADVVSPMFKITHTLALKNANLRQTRDLLLPRLVSGEIAV